MRDSSPPVRVESCSIRSETFLNTVSPLNCELGLEEQKTVFFTKRSGIVSFDSVCLGQLYFNSLTLELVVCGFTHSYCIYKYLTYALNF